VAKKHIQRAVRKWLPRVGPPGRYRLVKADAGGICSRCDEGVASGAIVVADVSTQTLEHEECSDPRLVAELRAEEDKRSLVAEAERTGKKPARLKGLPPPRRNRRRRGRTRTVSEEEAILRGKIKRAGASGTSFAVGSSGGSRKPADEDLHKRIGPVQNYGADT